MKTMSKKARLACAIPAAVAMGAVMIYCLTAYVAEDKMFLYSIAAAVIVYLLMYLLVGRRMQAQETAAPEKQTELAASSAVPADSASQTAAGTRDTINLREHLTQEEIRILLSDLQAAGDRVPADQKAALTALAGQISGAGIIYTKTLPVCVAAVENGLSTFSAFGLAPAGHSNLHDKLKKLEESK